MYSQVSSESPYVLVASALLKSCDSFGMANSFNAVGKNVLVAFLGSFLKLEIRLTRGKHTYIKTSSLMAEIFFSSDFFLCT
jgi:hypothetical protein